MKRIIVFFIPLFLVFVLFLPKTTFGGGDLECIQDAVAFASNCLNQNPYDMYDDVQQYADWVNNCETMSDAYLEVCALEDSMEG